MSMKLLKPLAYTALLFGALTSSIHANAAMAVQHSACQFVLETLEANGFMQDAIYHADEVEQLLQRMNINLANPHALQAGRSYQVNFKCYSSPGIANAELIATPVDIASQTVTSLVNQTPVVIRWTATGYHYQAQ